MSTGRSLGALLADCEAELRRGAEQYEDAALAADREAFPHSEDIARRSRERAQRLRGLASRCGAALGAIPGDGRRRWSGKDDDDTLPSGWKVLETDDFSRRAVGAEGSILTWTGDTWMEPEGRWEETRPEEQAYMVPLTWWMPMPSPPEDEP